MSDFLNKICDIYENSENDFEEELYHIAASTLNELGNIEDSAERIINNLLIRRLVKEYNLSDERAFEYLRMADFDYSEAKEILKRLEEVGVKI